MSPTRMLGICLVLAACAPPAAGASVLSRGAGNPAASEPPPRALESACFGARAQSAACLAQAESAIDAARAMEGVGPIALPPGFQSMSVAEQLLVLTDLERADRGLSVIAGLSPSLDQSAQQGAAARSDPLGPSAFAWGGNWFGGASSLLADYAWMYDDGPGSGNLDCSSAGESGCWGHRDNILNHLQSPEGMGAAGAGASLTELFVGAYGPGRAGGGDAPTGTVWAQIVKTLPLGVSPAAVTLVNGATSGQLLVSASGQAAMLTAAVAAAGSGWSVSPSQCTLAIGKSCTLHLSAPSGTAPSTAGLTLTGPNGPQTVRLARLIRQTITATAAALRAPRGRADTISGTVAPAVAGQRVLLQLAQGRRWANVAATTVGPTGSFAFSVASRVRGTSRYRVLKPATGGYQQVATRVFAIRTG